ncbi:DUF1016 domain-containing protein [Acinetobacter baumannii]|nr:DUF1016 domain-containing protein [Acinetobacter baumannii]
MGNQYKLEYNGKKYFIDSLFIDRSLLSFFVIELTIGSSKAKYVGKTNLYLSLFDGLEKDENENQFIGIIFCAD